jgi:HSP20 family protein
MPIFRWGQSWRLFHDLEREVDRLLHGVDMTLHGVRFGRQYPAINLYQLEDEYLLTAELPGMRADELDVSIAGGILTLKGTRAQPENVPDDQFRRHERFHGAWQRSFSLPERVQEERLAAEFNDGVLKIHLPKADEIQPRQILVNEGTD